MTRKDGKRNFALRNSNGNETSVFSGNVPRQAALKAARRLDNVGTSESTAPREEIRIREKGTDKVHIYDGWAWEEPAPSNKPDWMPNEITKANVSKKATEHIEGAYSGGSNSGQSDSGNGGGDTQIYHDERENGNTKIFDE